MAFNPNNYRPPVEKALPVVLLLDVSGSMTGAPIEALYNATVDMLKTFVVEQRKETNIKVAIITFGSAVELHTPFTPVTNLDISNFPRFHASGLTPLGTALKMAKDMIEDKNVLPSPVYRPAVILVSDGQPNDKWEKPMDAFINEGRSQKCQRFAMAIGNGADTKMLRKFAESDANMIYAENAGDIVNSFKKFTMSVSVRNRSTNPDKIPTPNATFDNKGSCAASIDDLY